MNTNNLLIDEFGIVRAAGLHDAVLLGIEYAANDRLLLRWKSAVHSDTRVLLREVVSVGFKDVVQGMILSEIFCARTEQGIVGDNFAKIACRILLGGNVLEKDMLSAGEGLLRRYPNNQLVLFESSYGGSIAAICGTLQILDKMPSGLDD